MCIYLYLNSTFKMDILIDEVSFINTKINKNNPNLI